MDEFIAKWTFSEGSERRNKDLFLSELCDALGIPRPDAAMNDPTRDLYIFEKPIPMVGEDGKTTNKSADLYKHGCFLLEAKQAIAQDSKSIGKTKRGTRGWDIAMHDALGQALGYVGALDDPPPFIILCDIGYVFELYADFDKTRRYNPFPNALRKRIYLKDIAAHADTLRAIFTDPYSLDPSRYAEKVTREVASSLAELAQTLESQNHSPEAVAKFLMRCLFTMFAESVQLLPKKVFSKALETEWLVKPQDFALGMENLWRAMNDGLYFPFVGKLLKFNGGLFSDPTALALGKDAIRLLLDAAGKDWAGVEPAIFGTLLERALDPKERHKLGAHYTPRAYVERLVRPTIEEPLREEWENVQTAARKLYKSGKEKDARDVVRVFHEKLCQTCVLDPACGSGNFLYVTLDLFKRIESEVLALLHDMGERQELLHAEGIRVTPGQFLGIEVKPWAKEIADLVLWIGYLQWHYRTHGKLIPPPEPVLRDFRNIECRDALLSWDREDLVRDAKGKPVTRWDGETMKKHPVTGEDVPDEMARVVIHEYVNPRKAEWPRADFIVGNPPFIGNKRMRTLLGDGYVQTLRRVYDDVPEKCDYVMYWWARGALFAAERRVRRTGFITTNSIGQVSNRQLVAGFLKDARASLAFAIPDHPWVDCRDGAAVRIAMTVVAAGHVSGELARVIAEFPAPEGERDVVLQSTRGAIHADLSIGVNVSSVQRLKANQGLSFQGVILVGEGFRVEPDELKELGYAKKRLPPVVRPYMSGRDLMQSRRDWYVIDLFGLDEEEVRTQYPEIHQRLTDKVKPHRLQNRDEQRRRRWWLFGRSNESMRMALGQLPRYIATVETSKHKPFIFVDGRVCPDHKLYVIASDDAAMLGVLSSRIHALWAIAAGGTLEDRPTWTNTTCFWPFPFPVCTIAQRKKIRRFAETLDSHRKERQSKHPDLTLTGMYNVLEKLRKETPLSDKERVIHGQGLVSVLRDIHDELDQAVFEAYGWSPDLTDEQILENLVALNAVRAADEERGIIQWLRPEFQNPAGKSAATQTEMAGLDEEAKDEETASLAASSVKSWPKKLAEQIVAVRDDIAKRRGFFTAADIMRHFKGAKVGDIDEMLEGLAALGIVHSIDGHRWQRIVRRARG
jgi:hypothetical protein